MKIKITALLLVVLMLVFSFSVYAVGSIEIDAGKDFHSYDENPTKVLKLVGKDKSEFNEYCAANGVIYFAVNDSNTKQIKVTSIKNTFSESIGNLSLLEETEIQQLVPSLIGDSEIEFTIEDKNSQKFIYFEQTLSDSGGEYSYISYVTVAGEAIYTLNFYTSKSEKTDYAKEVFESFECKDFINYNPSNKATGFAFTIILSVISLWLIYTIVRDKLHEKKADTCE